jgi:hypothetical protein
METSRQENAAFPFKAIPALASVCETSFNLDSCENISRASVEGNNCRNDSNEEMILITDDTNTDMISTVAAIEGCEKFTMVLYENSTYP